MEKGRGVMGLLRLLKETHTHADTLSGLIRTDSSELMRRKGKAGAEVEHRE